MFVLLPVCLEEGVLDKVGLVYMQHQLLPPSKTKREKKGKEISNMS